MAWAIKTVVILALLAILIIHIFFLFISRLKFIAQNTNVKTLNVSNNTASIMALIYRYKVSA